MRKKYHKHDQQRPRLLRDKAEARLAQARITEPATHVADELLHELQVHQIELEIQNEELRRAHVALEASRDSYFDLYEFAPIGYLTLTAEGMIAEINLTGATLLGVERKKLIHRRFAWFVADQNKDRWHRLFLSVMGDTKEERQCFDLILNRGDEVMIYAHFDCLRRAGIGESPVLRIAFADTTQLNRAEADLRVAATAFESQEGIFITDANNVIIKVNRAFTKITGYSAEETIGQTPSLLSSEFQDPTFHAVMSESISKTGAWHGEFWNQRKNGDIYPVWLNITAVQGDDCAVLHYVASMTDITQQKVAFEKIEQLAFYDPLTNLPNRRLLKDRLHHALASSARSRRQGALLFIDLDNFKTLNDTLGHDIGDLLLKQVAQRLVSIVREEDTAARLGGDEFVVMLEGLSENSEEAAVYAETAGKKILAALNKPYLLAGHDYRCTSSIGATMFYDHLAAEDDLLKHVDIAMYQAKHAGRNTLCFFDQAMQSVLTERAAMEADLRLALEKNQFKLYYQMQTTHDGKAVGAEMLIRWQHPELGLILPMEFIPLAEETGLILPIGQWELEMACAQLKTWEKNPQTKHLQLSVNVCARQLHQADFFEKIHAVVKKYAIEPNLLKLELTESMVLNDIDDTINKMQVLKTIGVGFSLDDFGTGYSSLSYLTQLPFDQLKIDQSFVCNIDIKRTDAVIVQTIIGMANHLGMDVIAEGVETEDQRAFLELHGCPLCQGYLFSKPVPLQEFEALLCTGESL